MSAKKEPVYISRIRELLELKSVMAGRDIEVQEIADHVGVTRQTVSAWMSTRGVLTPPRAKYQRRLEDFFGFPGRASGYWLMRRLR